MRRAEKTGMSEVRFQVLLAGMALMAILLGAIGTRHGAGLTPDTLLYLDTADQLRQTGEYPLELLGGRRSSNEISPLYPIALALVGAGLDNPELSRWLNLALYGGNVFVFGLLLRRLTGSSRGVALSGTFLAATSLVLLEIHTASWSEPLYLLLQMGWMWALADYLDRPGWRRALGVGLLVGLSPLCRLAGVTSLVAAALTLLWKGRRHWKHWPVILLGSVGPLWLMLAWNKARSGGRGTGTASLNVHWPGDDIVVLWNTVAAWLVPGIDRFDVVPGQDGIALLLVLTWIVLLIWGGKRQPEIGESRLYQVALVHTITYPLTLLALVATIKSDLPLEQRIMMPMHITMMLVTLAQLGRAPAGRPRQALLALWMLIYLLPALVGVRIMATRGRGYLSPAYQAPRLYQYLREHPPETLHTNEPGALWFYLRRYGAGLETPARGPLLVFRVDHPLPPRHQAGVKRPGVRRDKISQMVEDTPLLLYGTEGQVDLYLPTP